MPENLTQFIHPLVDLPFFLQFLQFCSSAVSAVAIFSAVGVSKKAPDSHNLGFFAWLKPFPSISDSVLCQYRTFFYISVGIGINIGHFWNISIGIGIWYWWKYEISVYVDYRYWPLNKIGISINVIGRIKMISIGIRFSSQFINNR